MSNICYVQRFQKRPRLIIIKQSDHEENYSNLLRLTAYCSF